MPEAEISLRQDLETLRALALDAGALAMSFKHDARETITWSKKGGSPVTEADLAVNQLCAERLGDARPEYGWLSEETADVAAERQKARCWVVDPIDGTRAYMRDDPNWCIGLAVVENGQPVVGVIYAPELGKMYEACRGGGAYLNGERIDVSSCMAEGGCRLIASSQMVAHRGWPTPWPRVTLATPKPNATLLRLAFVADGSWDATVILGQKSDWDVAAGAILVTEAGGLATTHLAEPFHFNQQVPAQRSVIAAGKALHSLLVQRSAIVAITDPQDPSGSPHPTIRTEPKTMGDENTSKQLLHIVFGGELKDVTEVEFEDLSKVDFVGAFASYAEAYDAWKGAAQRTVDNAEVRYFILHAHRLLDPETGSHHHV